MYQLVGQVAALKARITQSKCIQHCHVDGFIFHSVQQLVGDVALRGIPHVEIGAEAVLLVKIRFFEMCRHIAGDVIAKGHNNGAFGELFELLEQVFVGFYR